MEWIKRYDEAAGEAALLEYADISKEEVPMITSATESGRTMDTRGCKYLYCRTNELEILEENIEALRNHIREIRRARAMRAMRGNRANAERREQRDRQLDNIVRMGEAAIRQQIEGRIVPEDLYDELDEALPGWADKMAIEGHLREGPGFDRTYCYLGLDAGVRTGVLVPTSILVEFGSAVTSTTSRSGIINMARGMAAAHFATSLAPLYEVATKISGPSAAGVDAMACRVALWEALRQKRFSQPSGVPWLLATKRMPITTYHRVDGAWGYRAVAIGQEALSKIIERNDG